MKATTSIEFIYIYIFLEREITCNVGINALRGLCDPVGAKLGFFLLRL